jgi:hypothetical protein
MTATYVTATVKRSRTRIRSRQWSVAGLWLAVWAGLAILEGLIILDADSRGPEFEGLRQADRVSGTVLVAVALAWFLTWLPVFSVSTRLRALSPPSGSSGCSARSGSITDRWRAGATTE